MTNYILKVTLLLVRQMQKQGDNIMHKIISVRTFWLMAGYFLFLIWFSTLYSSQIPGNIENQDHIPSRVRFNDIKTGTLLQKTDESGVFTILPQLKTKVDIVVNGMVSTTTVEQQFTNPSSEVIEAVYVFPLPHTAAVHEMVMRIGDRLVLGTVKEREEAKKTYEKAKKAGKRAALTEQERPNIFTNSVANIMPGDTIIVRLKLVDKLTYDSGEFSLRFPMVVAPRFIPGAVDTGYSGTGWSPDTEVVPDASRITPPVVPPNMRSGQTISITVDLDAGIPIKDISSESHEIHTWQVAGNQYGISLKETETIPNKDFILLFTPEVDAVPETAWFTSEYEGDDYFMLMCVPPIELSSHKEIPREMVFVIDISSSMTGTSIYQAKTSLINGLGNLHPNDYFNIIAFNNSYYFMNFGSIPATTENIKRGIQYSEQLAASGGTMMYPALEHAYLLPSIQNVTKMIILLTDGAVGNETQLMNLVNQYSDGTRFFAVGIGSAPNSYLLAKVTRLGRGTFTHISRSSLVEERMTELFHKIESPVLTDLTLSLPVDVQIFPDPLPDLFVGEPLLVFGKMSQTCDTKGLFSGNAGDVQFEYPISLDDKSQKLDPAIPVIWARKKISGLMEEYNLGKRNVRDDVVKLGIDYQLLTKFTSFVAVEHIIVNPTGKNLTSAIPTELPEGWKYNSVFGDNAALKPIILPQTATSMPSVMLFGILMTLLGLLSYLTSRKISKVKSS